MWRVESAENCVTGGVVSTGKYAAGGVTSAGKCVADGERGKKCDR